MIIHTTGRNNCGGRCLIHAHVEDGQIKRLTTENLEEAEAAGCEFPMTACVRGCLLYTSDAADD